MKCAFPGVCSTCAAFEGQSHPQDRNPSADAFSTSGHPTVLIYTNPKPIAKTWSVPQAALAVTIFVTLAASLGDHMHFFPVTQIKNLSISGHEVNEQDGERSDTPSPVAFDIPRQMGWTGFAAVYCPGP